MVVVLLAERLVKLHLLLLNSVLIFFRYFGSLWSLNITIFYIIVIYNVSLTYRVTIIPVLIIAFFAKIKYDLPMVPIRGVLDLFGIGLFQNWRNNSLIVPVEALRRLLITRLIKTAISFFILVRKFIVVQWSLSLVHRIEPWCVLNVLQRYVWVVFRGLLNLKLVVHVHEKKNGFFVFKLDKSYNLKLTYLNT